MQAGPFHCQPDRRRTIAAIRHHSRVTDSGSVGDESLGQQRYAAQTARDCPAIHGMVPSVSSSYSTNRKCECIPHTIVSNTEIFQFTSTSGDTSWNAQIIRHPPLRWQSRIPLHQIAVLYLSRQTQGDRSPRSVPELNLLHGIPLAGCEDPMPQSPCAS